MHWTIKYNKGYIPKIKYWVDVLINASTPKEQETALTAIKYFQGRHKDVYGEVVTIESLYMGEE